MSLNAILMLLLALIAGVLLFVGLAQALEGRPRSPARRSPRVFADPHRFSAEERELEQPGRGARAGGSPFATPPEQISFIDVEPLRERAEPALAAPAPTFVTLTPELVVECARLLAAGHPGELRALAEPLLKSRGRGRARTVVSYDRALLWCLVGLAQRDEGNEGALRAAFEQGVRALPKGDATRPDPLLLALAETLGGRLLASAEAAADAAGVTLAGLRLSVGLLRGVAASHPGQPAADDTVARAREALAKTCERKVTALLERGDRVAAQRWIEEVAGWEELGGRTEGLAELCWEAVTAEVTRLTSEALESAADPDAAVRTLESAEAVVRDLPSSASRQVVEMRRRLWWSYTKLGVQRMENGDEGAALEPLYHALRLAEGDADRESETRRSLAEGLDALAARAAGLIAERLGAGDHAAAETAAQALCRAIDRGLAEGVSQDELAGALDRRRHVMGLIAQADAR